MDYALCATYGQLPMKPLCIPSTLKSTKLQFNLSHSSHLLYSGFTHLPVTKLVSPVIRAVDKSASPSSDGKRGGKIIRGAVGASMVLACAIGVFSCRRYLNPKAIAGPEEMFSKSPSNISAINLGGKYALGSLLEVSKNLASDEVKPLKESTFEFPWDPSTEDVRKLKMEAVKLIKAGETNKAMVLLNKAYWDCKRRDSEQEHEVDMAIAEILISQGKYKEASKLPCLEGEKSQGPGSDPRFALYKAVVETMLDNKDEAKKWWNEFFETVGEGFDPNSPPM